MLKRFFVLMPICLGLLYWLSQRTLAQTSLTWSRWGYSEWLINYQGGFVRRGLPGEIVHQWAHGGGALHGVHFFLFGVCGLVLVLWTLLFLVQKEISLGAAAVSFLMPGSMIHALATNQFFYRKEVFFAIPLLTMAIGWVLLERRPQKWVFVFFVVGSSLLGGVATLFHETFFLAGLPALILMWSYGGKNLGLPLKQRRWLIGAFSLPVIFAFIFSCIYSGDAEVSRQIWDSLAPLDRQRLFSEFPGPNRAILALASSASVETFGVLRGLLGSGLGLWVLILGSVILCLSAWLTIAAGEKAMKDSHRKALWSMGVFLFVCELPIYLFSEDWGRWIVWLGTAVLIVWTAAWKDQKITSLYPGRLCAANFWPSWSYRAALGGLILWNLFFSIPETGFSDRLEKNIFQAAFFFVVDGADLQNPFRVRSSK